MDTISLPTDITVVNDDNRPHRAAIMVEPCYPGYAATLGNALRRVLLSSLPGSAVTALKIKGVHHEFSTLEHVKEDVVAILLNCKQLKFKTDSAEPITLSLKAKGRKIVTAKDFEKNSLCVPVDPKAVIATMTHPNANFEAEFTIEQGIGYIPVENREKQKLPIGTIALDAVFTPVRNVNYETEHVRIAQMTDYERLVLTIETDGSVSPTSAFQTAAKILSDHFAFFLGDLATKKSLKENEKESAPSESESDEAVIAEKSEQSHEE